MKSRQLRLGISLLGLVCMLMPAQPGASQVVENGEKECNGDTVDRMGPEIARKSRLFLVQLQAAIRADDRKKISTMAQYPLKVFLGEKTRRVTGAAEFVRDYDKIITQHVKKVVLEQSAKCLFGNTQGFMIGDGEIWFNELQKGSFKVISVNTNAP